MGLRQEHFQVWKNKRRQRKAADLSQVGFSRKLTRAKNGTAQKPLNLAKLEKTAMEAVEISRLEVKQYRGSNAFDLAEAKLRLKRNQEFLNRVRKNL